MTLEQAAENYRAAVAAFDAIGAELAELRSGEVDNAVRRQIADLQARQDVASERVRQARVALQQAALGE
jgi:hypothetical protein